MMDRDVLWSVIERVRQGEAPSRAMFLRMGDVASELSDDELRARHDQWVEAFRAADLPALHGVAADLLGGCGDDHFLDVRAWLIAHGRETYERVMRDHAAYGDLPVPEPAWESGELSGRYTAIGVDRGVFPATWGQQATVAWPPVHVPKKRTLPWRDRGYIHVDGVDDWAADVVAQLVETGRFEGTMASFVVETGDATTVRFEPSDALCAAIPYGPVEGESVDARLFDRLLRRLDCDDEGCRSVAGMGWFGLSYLGLDEQGQDRWELGYVPSRVVLLAVGVPADQVLPDPGTKRGIAAAKVEPASSEADPDDDPPERSWWRRLLGR